MMRVALGVVAAAAALLAPALSAQSRADAPIPPAEQQIAAAVLPAPAELRPGATVLGYAPDGGLVRLREGTNSLVCLADDPRAERFHVACYHASLEPFMARGRELRAQGLGPEAVDSVRNAEIAAGRVPMPRLALLYSLTAPEPNAFDPATGTIRGARPLFVVYVPFATPESVGLSPTPVRGAPWLMHPGTAKAHIMFTPGM